MRSPCFYIVVLFLVRGLGFRQGGGFRFGPSMGFSKLEFLAKIAALERRLEGRLQRPSPCLIRSASDRDRVWGLSENNEKLLECCILMGYSRAFGWNLTSAELERINHGATFQSWHDFQINWPLKFFSTTNFTWLPRSACPIVATTAVSR